ncbi:hypothetical protein TKK_0017124 [Trichogramma kaykai]
MNNQRSGDGLKINHFQYMQEVSFMDPFLQQKPVLSSLNQTKKLKRKKVLQAPQSTQKKIDTIEKNSVIERINAQVEDILQAVKANLSGSRTPADQINYAQSSTAAPAYYSFNPALPSTSRHAASASSHPLNRAVPCSSTVALPSMSQNAVSAPTYLHAAPSTSGNSAVQLAATTNDSVGLDLSITNNSPKTCSDYSNILRESFKKIPAGKELNCFKHVLKEFLQFRRSMKKY